MGVSNAIVIPFYKECINAKGSVALLGSSDNDMFEGDLYDLSLGNWEINSEWKLSKKYDTIICTRCAYFAKDPEGFIKRCYDNLNDGGLLYADWGLGDHWRFPDFKVGWIKGGEHEYAYSSNNFLWSSIWGDKFLDNDQSIEFQEGIKKYGYSLLKDSIYKEVPSVLKTDLVEEYFDAEYKILTIRKPYLQMYIMVCGAKR